MFRLRISSAADWAPYEGVGIAATHLTAQITVSVCTGAFLLGKAGLLAGKNATTHWDDIAGLERMFPDTEPAPVNDRAEDRVGSEPAGYRRSRGARDALPRERARFISYMRRSASRSRSSTPAESAVCMPMLAEIHGVLTALCCAIASLTLNATRRAPSASVPGMSITNSSPP
jgi:hypothetical protein